MVHADQKKRFKKSRATWQLRSPYISLIQPWSSEGIPYTSGQAPGPVPCTPGPCSVPWTAYCWTWRRWSDCNLTRHRLRKVFAFPNREACQLNRGRKYVRSRLKSFPNRISSGSSFDYIIFNSFDQNSI